MRLWLRERPWIWIVVFFVVMISFNLVFVAIAEFNRPIVIERTE
jgi:hypothetical protein